MHNHNRTRARSDMLLQLQRVEIASDWINIDKDRTGAEVYHDFGGSCECIDRDDYLVARLQTNCIEGKVHCRCRRVNRQPVRNPDSFSKLTLKALRLGTGR